MYKFSKTSEKHLRTCHPYLQLVLREAIKVFDFSVLCGHRGEEEQNEAYRKGYSQVKYPNSKHNSKVSLAVDAVPFPIDWSERERLHYMAGLFKGIAIAKGIDGLEWGGHFKDFFDGYHFQLNLQEQGSD